MPPRKKSAPASDSKSISANPPNKRGRKSNASEVVDEPSEISVEVKSAPASESKSISANPPNKRGRKSNASEVANEPSEISMEVTNDSNLSETNKTNDDALIPNINPSENVDNNDHSNDDNRQEIPAISSPIKPNNTPENKSNQSSNLKKKQERSKKSFNLTVTDICNHKLTLIASEYWAPGADGEKAGKYDEKLMKEIYETELKDNKNISKILDFSFYLEQFLWHHFKSSASLEHLLSIIIMINEKCKESSSIIDDLTKDEPKFISFFESLVNLILEKKLHGDYSAKVSYTLLLVNIFRSLENAVIRKAALKYLSLPIWDSLSKTKLETLLNEHPQINKHWKHLKNQKNSKESTKKPNKNAENDFNRESQWFPTILNEFLHEISSDTETADEDVLLYRTQYIARFLELIIDLLSQLPTRRFLNILLEDLHFLIRCKRSHLFSNKNFTSHRLFNNLLDSIDNYMHFEIDDQSGEALNSNNMIAKQNTKIHKLQTLAYNNHRESLKDIVFSSTGSLGNPRQLVKFLEYLSVEELYRLALELSIISERDIPRLGEPSDSNLALQDYLFDLFSDYFKYRQGQLEALNLLPLHPNEKLLWDETQIPFDNNYHGDSVLALPKLNLQYLTIYDFLLRNFNLYRLESAFEIREDLVDTIKRMGPRQNLGGQVIFAGWSRMAIPTSSLSITEVAKPSIGEVIPAYVKCTIEFDVSKFTGAIRAEWDAIKDHDVVFLVCIRNPSAAAGKELDKFERERTLLSQGMKPRGTRDFQWESESSDFPDKYGVSYVRAGEVYGSFNEDSEESRGMKSNPKRKLKLKLDPAQYYSDIKEGLDCYDTVNLLIRRKPKENNNKAILYTIRELMNSSDDGRTIPSWLHDIFLGYGKPDAAYYRNLVLPNSANQTKSSTSTDEIVEDFDYADTFLDISHVKESFPDSEFNLVESTEFSDQAPFCIKIIRKSTRSSVSSSKDSKEQEQEQLFLSRGASGPTNPSGPYTHTHTHTQSSNYKNTIRFTPGQIEAIRSGMNQGLTLIVGPPGSGKTDVAVQTIANLYRNFPNQKILIVTHSNSALNDIFEKIRQKDVDPRHMLRLGSGEKDLVGQEDFSKTGRIQWCLARRLQLLEQVQRLGSALGIPGDVGSSCETSGYFFLEHIHTRIEKFEHDLKISQNTNTINISQIFPFGNFFWDIQSSLFTGDQNKDISEAYKCIQYIKNLFSELAEFRAFELLRTSSQRGDYILTKQARIVALTCTHAAMTREKFIELGFTYDSLIMEEAAQVLEVETLIPMLLQKSDPIYGCRLKRVVLIGDHHQLPPVVQNMAFKKYSQFDQSLFARFIRLGVPSVLLDKQGRARAEIALLYAWRYEHNGQYLQNLPSIENNEIYKKANIGFSHTFQLINVNDFQGEGERCPTPYFYQNLGEAEYVVAVYQYMRLLGYPAEKISIITTYNGQKNLIRDIIAQRCMNPIFGKPGKITTVDKYQGQQNDYILLSLVRTLSVGHLRDIRRLVVAMSRARLGLYVFGRQNLFENCFELAPIFNQLVRTSECKLELFTGEQFPSTSRLSSDSIPSNNVLRVEDVTAMGVLVYQMVQQIQQQSSSS